MQHRWRRHLRRLHQAGAIALPSAESASLSRMELLKSAASEWRWTEEGGGVATLQRLLCHCGCRHHVRTSPCHPSRTRHRRYRHRSDASRKRHRLIEESDSATRIGAAQEVV